MAAIRTRTGIETTKLDETPMPARPDVDLDALYARRARGQMLELDVAERRWSLVERKVLLGVTVGSFVATVILGSFGLAPGATLSATSGATFMTALAVQSRRRPAQRSQGPRESSYGTQGA